MAGETTITIIGNLTGDPELRFTPAGAAVANFTIASTPRAFDRDSGQWVDGDPLFLRCSLWRDAAENAAESLTKGTRVIATGFLKSRSYETKEGEKRTVWGIEADHIGPSLRRQEAQVRKVQQQVGGQGGHGWGQQPAQGQPQASGWGAPQGQQAATSADPWQQQPAVDNNPPF